MTLMNKGLYTQVVVTEVRLSNQGLALAVLDSMRQSSYVRMLAEQRKLDALLDRVKEQVRVLDSVTRAYNKTVRDMDCVASRNQR